MAVLRLLEEIYCEAALKAFAKAWMKAADTFHLRGHRYS
jgi:hypothetical protein